MLVAPLAANLSAKVDPRLLVFCDVMWLGAITLLRRAGLAFVLAATAIWFAPRPTRVADTSAAH